MTEKIEDGGPAFPYEYTHESLDHVPYGELGTPRKERRVHPGMSLRDWFAGQVLAGLCANPECDGDFDAFSRDAYALADAMLAERTKEVKS